MKTKYFLTAMALPLAFAACTNEEFETIDSGLVGGEVVKMALSANYGTDGIESRMVNNNGTFLWDNTDVLGAAMPNTSTDGVYSNNRFVNSLTQPSAAADFTTQSTTVAGEYTFYYPYSASVTTAPNAGLLYTLPAVQEYDPTGVKMMNNNFMVAPRIKVDGNEPGTLTLPITMRSIYSYGLVNIRLADDVNANYSNISNLNIQKIIITYNSNVETDGRIDLSALPVADITTETLQAIQAGTYKEDGSNVTYPELKNKGLDEIRIAVLSAKDKALVAATDVYKTGTVLDLTTMKSGATTNKMNKIVISCVDEQNPNGIALSKGNMFSTRVLLPTSNNAGDASNVKILVYTDKGIANVTSSSTLAGGKLKAGHTVNLANVNRDGNAEALYISGTLDTSSNTVEAVSEADFIASMRRYAGMANPEITVNVNGFVMTPTAVAAIPSAANVTFTSNVTFEGDMTLKNMTFSGGWASLDSGKIKLGEGVNAAEKVIWVDGADVTVASSNVTLGTTQVISGKLTVDAVNANGERAAVTLQENKSIIVYKYNEGTTRELVIESEVNGAVSVMDGKATVNADMNGLSLGSKGVVDNYANVDIVSNDGTVNNYGTIAMDNTNNGVFNQMSEDAKLTVKDNSVTGVINTVAYSETTVTNQNLGEIIFVNDARVKADGNVTYQTPEDFKATDFSELPTAITKIEFMSDFTYDYSTDPNESGLATLKTAVKTLTFHGNLKLAKNWALNAGSTIEFVGEKANITGSYTLSNAEIFKAGVDLDGTANDVATKVYIGTNTTISGVTSVDLIGDATVWNDGTVKKADGASIGTITDWNGNAIN